MTGPATPVELEEYPNANSRDHYALAALASFPSREYLNNDFQVPASERKLR